MRNLSKKCNSIINLGGYLSAIIQKVFLPLTMLRQVANILAKEQCNNNLIGYLAKPPASLFLKNIQRLEI